MLIVSGKITYPLRILATALILGTPQAAAQAPLSSADFVVGAIKEGLDSAQLRSLQGAPDSARVEQHPFDPGAKLVTWYYPGIEVAFSVEGAVIGVTLQSPRMPTHRGLRVGDSGERVRDLYGVPGVVYEEDWDYSDPKHEMHVIRVRVRNGNVVWIYLGWLLD